MLTILHRLHVNIYDTNNSQFTVPQSVVALPADPTTSHKDSYDLVFNYAASPFAFWITRRSSPDDTPLFDTRVSSLPPTPVPPVIPGVNSSALDGFPLVFENQYLQVS
jgi:alpha-glucosidase